MLDKSGDRKQRKQTIIKIGETNYVKNYWY